MTIWFDLIFMIKKITLMSSIWTSSLAQTSWNHVRTLDFIAKCMHQFFIMLKLSYLGWWIM